MNRTRNRYRSWLALILAGASVVLVGGTAQSEGELSLEGPTNDAEIAALIADLGNPAYEKRTFATRRLCAIGLRARAALDRAGRDSHTEVALRARQILKVLDNLLFTEVTVRLSPSKNEIEWDESVDLILTLTNPSKYPANIPFELGDMLRSTITGDARQVADMLDVAEWMIITGPAGRARALRIDDIAADPAVGAVVQERLNDGPLSILPPGEEATLRIHAFNRGWGRFPLLDRGAYSIRLEYVPSWSDDALASARVGRVASEGTTLTITNSAPDEVSRRGVEASLTLERDGGDFVARLTNRMDLPMSVNRNFGGAPPFAQGRWVVERGATVRDVPLLGQPGASWHEFDTMLLVSVDPGASVELARIDVNTIRKKMAAQGAGVGGPSGEVHFSYSNRCDRQWQRRQGSVLLGNAEGPAVFRTLLPRHLLSGWHTSSHVPVPNAE